MQNELIQVKNPFVRIKSALPICLIAIWGAYMLIDFAFRHGHVTSDGRYFSHIHYNKDKDSHHGHTEEELILLDILSNPSFLDVDWPDFESVEWVLVPFHKNNLPQKKWISLALTETPSLRAPPSCDISGV